MADADKVTELRDMIGESIPPGGAETDTLFTDEKIGLWIDGTISLQLAAVKGWQVKMAHYADLVNVTDGAAAREMSDLFAHAKDMVKMYMGLASGPTAGRTRVGKIIRQ